MLQGEGLAWGNCLHDHLAERFGPGWESILSTRLESIIELHHDKNYEAAFNEIQIISRQIVSAYKKKQNVK